jgi:hypothetical protein
MSDPFDRLRELEDQRAALINSISVLELVIFTNQQAIENLQAQADTSEDPTAAFDLIEQIDTLQTTIALEQARLTADQAELEAVELEIEQLLPSAFPNAEPPPPPPPPPPPAVFAGLGSVAITTAVGAANVLKAGVPSIKIPGLDPGQLAGITGSISAGVSAAKDAITGAKQMSGALQSATAAAASALGGAKAAAAVAKGAGAVTALTNLAKTASTAVNVASGIGKFGLKPEQLEAQGLIKPGAIQAFFTSKPPAAPTAEDTAEAERVNKEGGSITAAQVAVNRQLNTVLSSPAIWSGKDQINGITQVLDNATLQTKSVQETFKGGLAQLSQLGATVGASAGSQLGALATTASKFGAAAAADWAKGLAPPGLVNQMNSLAKNTQQAVSLVDSTLKTFGSVPFNPAGKIGTVDRATLNTAFAQVLGNPKIPVPTFAPAPSTKTATEKTQEYRTATNELFAALQKYNKILAENNNDSTAPAVVAANAELQAIRKRVEELRP